MDKRNKEDLELLEMTCGSVYLDKKEIKNMTGFELKIISHDMAEVIIKKVVRID